MPNADDLHTQRIEALSTALQTAIDFLSLPKTGALAWARDLHYRDDVWEVIEDAIDRIKQAQRIIDTHENG